MNKQNGKETIMENNEMLNFNDLRYQFKFFNKSSH